jgi:hypothetical protein
VSATTNDIDAARSEILAYFQNNGLDTSIVETAYSNCTGGAGYGRYWLWADSTAEGLGSTLSYAEWQTGQFWSDVADAYSAANPEGANGWDVATDSPYPDPVLNFLQTGTEASSPDVQSANRVTPAAVAGAVAQTASDVATDAANVAKKIEKGLPLVPAALALAGLWWISR